MKGNNKPIRQRAKHADGQLWFDELDTTLPYSKVNKLGGISNWEREYVLMRLDGNTLAQVVSEGLL